MKLPCLSVGTMKDLLKVPDAIRSSRIVPSYAITRLICRVFEQHHFSNRFSPHNWIYKSRRLMIHVEIAYDPQIDRINLDYQYFVDKKKLSWGVSLSSQPTTAPSPSSSGASNTMRVKQGDSNEISNRPNHCQLARRNWAT